MGNCVSYITTGGIDLKKHFRMSALVMATMVVLLCSCVQQKGENNRSFNADNIYNHGEATHIDHGALEDSGDMRSWIYATSETTHAQGQNDLNLVVSDPNEPVFLSFHQTGKDRKMRLLVYVDYISREFAIGESESKENYYNFEIKNNEEIILPIYIDYSDISLDISHRLIFMLIPGYDQYAKDKDDVTYNPVVSTMYQLYFKEYRENMTCEGSEEKTQAEKMVYYDGNGLNILLNTDYEMEEHAAEKGTRLPEKLYTIGNSEVMKMNCYVSNLSIPEKYALVFLTVGNLPAQIDGKEYMVVDLNNMQMGEKEIVLSLPVESGVYDTIGHVVYNPFEPMMNGESGFVYSSPRFSVEVLGKELQ